LGDLTPVNENERIFVIFLIIITTFIYAYLFGNIASMVAEFIPAYFIELNEKYQYVSSKIKKDKIPENAEKNIKEYYDLLWLRSKGIPEKSFQGLPSTIISDILLERYKQAFINNPIFNKVVNDFDQELNKPLIRSILKKIEIRMY